MLSYLDDQAFVGSALETGKISFDFRGSQACS
jgi:hypothetical protein